MNHLRKGSAPTTVLSVSLSSRTLRGGEGSGELVARPFAARKELFIATMVAVCLLFCPPSWGQKIQVARQREPYYVGEPVVVQLSVNGVDSSVAVSCKLKGDPADGITVQGPGVNRSVQSYMQSINGKVTRSETIDYRFNFSATASREGTFVIGPFEVTYDGKVQEVAGESFQFGKLENDPDMKIEFSLPEQTIYVGQEVPLTIRWMFAGDINTVQHAFSNLQIRSPLFDQFTFRDTPSQSRTKLTIATARGGVEIDADVTKETIDGREYIVVTGKRTLVPDAPGQYPSIPITCRTRKVTEWGRDFFGDLRVRRDAPALSAGKPLSLTVKGVPLSGRPAGYSGAVGRGFSIDVSANRSVVRVGDPISLTISIRGDGNLESISLPPLESSPGLTDNLFQIPHEQPAGTINGNQKQFNVTVRVKDTQVNQIPALTFAWFDPYQERFSVTTSKPIALQVMETQVISAADVVSAAPNGSGKSGNSGNTAAANTPDPAAPSAGMSFVGANLAIVRDPARLLVSGVSATAPQTIAAGCYILAALALIGGVVARRRSMVDHDIVRKKRLLQTIRHQVESAGNQGAHDAAAQVARALRDLNAAFELRDPAAVDDLIARCDNIIYATGQREHVPLSEIVSQAKRIVQQTAVR